VVDERGRQGAGRVAGFVRRALVLLAVAVAGVATGRVVASVLDDPTSTAAPPAAVTAAPTETATGSAPARPQPVAVAEVSLRRAAEVLHAWDAARATAYARGDPTALRRLYLPRSRAAPRDVRTLEAYAARGLAVRGLRTQVLALRVLTHGRGRLTLEVTDRLVGGRAVVLSAGRVTERAADHRAPGSADLALPRDGPTTRVLVLRQRAGEWRMGSVVPA
jgi:hypothetical protein